MKELSEKQHNRVTTACLAGAIVSAAWFDYGTVAVGAIALGVVSGVLAVCAYFCPSSASAATRSENTKVEERATKCERYHSPRASPTMRGHHPR